MRVTHISRPCSLLVDESDTYQTHISRPMRVTHIDESDTHMPHIDETHTHTSMRVTHISRPYSLLVRKEQKVREQKVVDRF